MFFVVHHRISNPAEFWAAAQRELPNLPAGIGVSAVYANATGDEATCLWSCETQDKLEAYLEEQTGRFAQNTFMAVDATKSMGLPA